MGPAGGAEQSPLTMPDDDHREVMSAKSTQNRSKRCCFTGCEQMTLGGSDRRCRLCGDNFCSDHGGCTRLATFGCDVAADPMAPRWLGHMSRGVTNDVLGWALEGTETDRSNGHRWKHGQKAGVGRRVLMAEAAGGLDGTTWPGSNGQPLGKVWDEQEAIYAAHSPLTWVHVCVSCFARGRSGATAGESEGGGGGAGGGAGGSMSATSGGALRIRAPTSIRECTGRFEALRDERLADPGQTPLLVDNEEPSGEGTGALTEQPVRRRVMRLARCALQWEHVVRRLLVTDDMLTDMERTDAAQWYGFLRQHYPTIVDTALPIERYAPSPYGSRAMPLARGVRAAVSEAYSAASATVTDAFSSLFRRKRGAARDSGAKGKEGNTGAGVHDKDGNDGGLWTARTSRFARARAPNSPVAAQQRERVRTCTSCDAAFTFNRSSTACKLCDRAHCQQCLRYEVPRFTSLWVHAAYDVYQQGLKTGAPDTMALQPSSPATRHGCTYNYGTVSCCAQCAETWLLILQQASELDNVVDQGVCIDLCRKLDDCVRRVEGHCAVVRGLQVDNAIDMLKEARAAEAAFDLSEAATTGAAVMGQDSTQGVSGAAAEGTRASTPGAGGTGDGSTSTTGADAGGASGGKGKTKSGEELPADTNSSSGSIRGAASVKHIMSKFPKLSVIGDSISRIGSKSPSAHAEDTSAAVQTDEERRLERERRTQVMLALHQALDHVRTVVTQLDRELKEYLSIISAAGDLGSALSPAPTKSRTQRRQARAGELSKRISRKSGALSRVYNSIHHAHLQKYNDALPIAMSLQKAFKSIEE